MILFYATGYSEPSKSPYLTIDDTEHGKAVKAKTDLEAGTKLVDISGPLVSYKDTRVPGDKESYFLQVDLDKYIKPAFPFYLFNHSCAPNCGINEYLQLFCLRDIKAGEELQWDYSTSMLERGWTLDCDCGQPHCRKLITDFDLLPRHLQMKYLDMQIVLPYIRKYLETKTN